MSNLKIILISQNEMLLSMHLCKRVLKQREDILRYGKTINNSFLGTVCSSIFCENCLFKNILMHLSTKVEGKGFFFSTRNASRNTQKQGFVNITSDEV